LSEKGSEDLIIVGRGNVNWVRNTVVNNKTPTLQRSMDIETLSQTPISVKSFSDSEFSTPSASGNHLMRKKKKTGQ
jgi:hypothetical protein